MSSLRRQEGYLLIDNSCGPGVSQEFVHASGKDAPAVGPDRVWESATVTCSHCNAVVILNPDRSRPRGYCRKCDSYTCDKPSCAKECLPFEKTIDTLREQAIITEIMSR